MFQAAYIKMYHYIMFQAAYTKMYHYIMFQAGGPTGACIQPRLDLVPPSFFLLHLTHARVIVPMMYGLFNLISSVVQQFYFCNHARGITDPEIDFMTRTNSATTWQHLH